MNVVLTVGGDESTRDHTAVYDDLGRLTNSAISSSETGYWIDRGFTYSHDWTTGEYWRTGPD
ncbi:MAG: hypothetical protein WBE26_20230, partial [Phycisphaerae bacterium]